MGFKFYIFINFNRPSKLRELINLVFRKYMSICVKHHCIDLYIFRKECHFEFKTIEPSGIFQLYTIEPTGILLI